MKHRLLLVMGWVLVWRSARAEDVEIPQCHVGGASALAECLDAKQKSEDDRLNGIYSLVIKMLDAGAVDPTSFFSEKKKSLVSAERAWIKFRDAQCDAQGAMLTGASALGIVGVSGECQLDMARERVTYLKGVARSLTSESKLCKKSPDLCSVD